MKNQHQVTVLVICYNQEKYIAQALDSILMQKVNFEYKITIVDDYSTDLTLEIIKTYQKGYPNIIEILPTEKNLGVTQNYKKAFKTIETKYVAILEGDDYWTSPNKLQIQHDFLEAHHECSFCAHKFLLQKEISYEKYINKYSYVKKLKDEPSFLNTEALISDNFIGNFSTCMYRKSIIDKIPEYLFELEVYDWMYNIMQSQFGLIGYIDQIMSVYRQHAKGVWSGKMSNDQLNFTLDLIDQYNKFLEFNFDKEFAEKKSQLEASNYNMYNFKNCNFEMLKYIFKLCIPKIFKIIYRLFVPPIFGKTLKFLKIKNEYRK